MTLEIQLLTCDRFKRRGRGSETVDGISTPLLVNHNRSLPELSTATSIKRGRIILISWTHTSLLNELTHTPLLNELTHTSLLNELTIFVIFCFSSS
jgi:hypothetical protein